ncbi:unnamed protein product [Laminaria digitata]
MRRERHEFRISWMIRWSVLTALIGWLVMGAFVAWHDEMPAKTLLSVGFFVAFFAAFVSYYWRMTYVVDEHGVTYRGATDVVHIPWEDINEVKDSELPLGGAYVHSQGGRLVLSHFVRGHAQLVDIIVARAGLFPT